jgi:hypothetical protein
VTGTVGRGEEERIRRLADVLLVGEPVFGPIRIEVFDDLAAIHTGVDIWRIEPVTNVGPCPVGSGYRIYAARPASPDSVRVRGIAQLDDGRAIMLDDAAGLSALAATHAVEPRTLGCLAALYADPQDYPRRILDAGDLAPTVASIDGGTVITVHTARVDYSVDETPTERIERWHVTARHGRVSWSIELGGA